jgi:hypothetical protein
VAGTLTTRWERRFTVAMEALRRAEWLGGRAGETGDEFDAASYHLSVSIDGALVGLVRTTPVPPSVLQAWSGGRAPLPHGPGVAEVTRGVVAASARGLGLYSLAMLETVLRLGALGMTCATAAVEPDFVGRPFLSGLGFAAVGDPIPFDDRPRRGTVVQCLLLGVDARREASWRLQRWSLLRRLDERGYRVDSDLEDDGGYGRVTYISSTRAPTAERP